MKLNFKNDCIVGYANIYEEESDGISADKIPIIKVDSKLFDEILGDGQSNITVNSGVS